MSQANPKSLTADLAGRFATIALGHVTKEYPHKLDHVLNGPDDAATPKALHPIFYGSFDWHSCVHGYWLLVRTLRLFPDMGPAREVNALLAAQLTPRKVEGELAYLTRPFSAGFERPYGWAWLFMLQAELMQLDTVQGRDWSAALAPLTAAFRSRMIAHLPKMTYPVRAGTHNNTAFAVALGLDYARVAKDTALSQALRTKAMDLFLGDENCPAWEPSGEDFLSPALMEAEAMRRVLPAAQYSLWLDRFLPGLATKTPATLFQPAYVSDRTDGKIAHLDGLNLSRAWCWRGIASAIDPADKARSASRTHAFAAADRHLAAGLPEIAGDYMGEHWLASFALLALSPPSETPSNG